MTTFFCGLDEETALSHEALTHEKRGPMDHIIHDLMTPLCYLLPDCIAYPLAVMLLFWLMQNTSFLFFYFLQNDDCHHHHRDDHHYNDDDY